MLCQCFCAPGLRGLGSGAANTIDITLEDEAPGFDSIVNAPRVAGHTSYSTSVAQPLRGVPIREGQLWYLSAEDRIEPVEFSLFINGFSFVQEGQEVAVVFSPFSLVNISLGNRFVRTVHAGEKLQVSEQHARSGVVHV